MKSAYEALPRDDQRFVTEYIRTLDPSASYLYIHPTHTKKTSYTASHKLLKKDEILAAVDEKVKERNARVEVTQDQVLREVLNAAMMDPIDLFDEKGNLKDLSMMPSYVRRCISGIEVEALYEGRGKDRVLVGYAKRLKLVSKDKMLELLGRHVGLFPNRHELSGIGGKPIEVNTTAVAMLQLLGTDDLKLLRSIKEALDRKHRDQDQRQLTHVPGNGGNGGGNGAS